MSSEPADSERSSIERLNVEVPALSAYRRVEDIEWGGIRGLTVSPDGQAVIACGANDYAGPACAIEFDAITGAPLRKFLSPLKGFYYAAIFQPAGYLAVVGGDIGKGECRVWRLAADAKVPPTPQPAASPSSAASKSAASPSPAVPASAPTSPAAQTTPLVVSQETSVAIATTGPCTAMAVHPDGRRFLLAQTIGKGSYPDSGQLSLYEWLE
ncbi:MAG: hypothetical protein ACKO38_03415 [Planctomycetota bacterium]